MKTAFKTLLVFGLALCTTDGRCTAQTNLTGIVVDRDGKPLAGVLFNLTGLGGSARHTGGIIGHQQTDSEGRFTVQLPRADLLADLQFNYRELAPVVLNKVKAGDFPLRVVMTEGMVVHGRIVELVNGKHVPIAGATIALEMPQEDFWYHKEQRTGSAGEFHFRISEPPRKRQWQLEYGGKRFKIDYDPLKPETFVELLADIKVTVDAERSAANGSQPFRSETNSTSSAAGSRR